MMPHVFEIAVDTWGESLEIMKETCQEPVSIVIMTGFALVVYFIFFRK